MNYLEEVRSQLIIPEGSLKVVDGGRDFDTTAIRRIVEAYVVLIDEWKLPSGSRIAIMPKRTVDWVCFMYALMFCGVIPLLLDAEMDEATIKDVLEDEKIIFSDRGIEIEGYDVRALPLTQGLAANDGLLESIDLSFHSALFTAHTSGTTGTPKKITYTNENIDWAVEEYSRIYNFDANSTILFSLPYHYCYSVIPCCIVPFAAGKTIVIAPEQSSTELIAQLIEKNKIEILVVNPYFYNDLSRIDLSSYNFKSLKICDSGGESIPLPVVRRIKEQTDVLITEGYGLTETTSLTHFLLPDSKGELRIGSVGQACTGVETRIVDAEGQTVNGGDIGELLVRGAMVAPYDNADIEATDENGWFATGDFFYEDTVGFFYFVSRKKDAVDIPIEIIGAAASAIPLLLGIQLIQDVAYKFNDSDDLIIFVVCDVNIDRELMNTEILSRLPDEISKIADIRYVARLPRTSTGKVKKKDL